MAYSRVANEPDKNSQEKYYLPRIDLKKCNVIIDGRIFMIIQSKTILKNIEN